PAPAATGPAPPPAQVRPAPITAQAAAAAGPGTPAIAVDSSPRVEMAKVATLYGAPEQGPLAKLDAGATARVTGRQGEWVRVQAEGWVRESDLRPTKGLAPVGVSAAEVRADPETWVGKVVEWRLQFISIQVGDPLRPEIPEGTPYLLARGPLPETGFVYAILPQALVARVKTVGPLGELRARVTVKAARTRYLPTPVVEVVEVVD
ncbi:MAG: hypothetical protein NW201_05210, partial [Gemmatimonadales bacterium]|nr:hypothetical protein [Gemmatimonadales bacterium]